MKWHLDPSSHLATADTDRKPGALPLWRGELGLHLTQYARAEAYAYLHAKFHLDPSHRLATIHQRHRQTGQTGQDLQKTVRKHRANRFTVFGRPFATRFALCYWSVVLSVCLSVCQ